jgi:hypothetical protein
MRFPGQGDESSSLTTMLPDHAGKRKSKAFIVSIKVVYASAGCVERRIRLCPVRTKM